MSVQEIIAQLKPQENRPVRLLLQEAGLDVSEWEKSKLGEQLENPNANSYRNSFWSFCDDIGNIALCIWYKDLVPMESSIEYPANLQARAIELEKACAAQGLTSGEKTSLRTRAGKAREFHRMVGKAYRQGKALRIIVLGDNVAMPGKASHPDRRLLDPSAWHVSSFDGESGALCLRRGLPPPVPARNPDADEDEEVLSDIGRIEALTELSETEKTALVKQRIGQGLFRQRLIVRWSTCALTGCTQLLVASHIVPWRECTTAQQRLGVQNGLLLTAHIDRLFDEGFISFDDRFQIMISTRLSNADCNILHVMPNRRLRFRHEDLLPALRWHRENVFKKSPD